MWIWYPKINWELNSLQEWLTLNKSTLNFIETKGILFNYRHRNIKSIIERVTEINFLAVTIDENLNWNAQTPKQLIKLQGL